MFGRHIGTTGRDQGARSISAAGSRAASSAPSLTSEALELVLSLSSGSESSGVFARRGNPL